MRKCEEEGEKDRHFTNKTYREKERKIDTLQIKQTERKLERKKDREKERTGRREIRRP